MGTILAVLNAIIALPKILDDIKGAISSLEGTIAAQQKAAFQSALATFQQTTAEAKSSQDYINAAAALHATLSQL